MASHALQEVVKPPDGASTAGTLAPASLSFKDLQSICSSTTIDFKPVSVHESRAAKVLACYGFPGLGHRHRSGDKVSNLSPPFHPCVPSLHKPP